MCEEYVKITKESYDSLIETSRKAEELESKLDRLIDLKIETLKTIGVEKAYSFSMSMKTYRLINNDMVIYSSDEALLKMKKELEETKNKMRENVLMARDYLQIPKWIRKMCIS